VIRELGKTDNKFAQLTLLQVSTSLVS